MSLLLDALKKAADDKKKNLDGSADDSLTPDQQEIENTDSLDLDLELTTDTSDDNTHPDNEVDFPEVDETSIVTPASEIKTPKDRQQDQAIATAQEAIVEPDVEHVKADISTPEETEAGAQNSPLSFTEDTSAETDKSEEPIDDTTFLSEDTSNTSPDKDTDTSNPATSPDNLTDITELNKKHAAEQALSALINKSNYYSQREQLKRTVIIALLVSLLLVGSAIFFYIKMDTATQELFIAQNNSAPVNRDAHAAPVIKQIQQSAPAIKVTKAVIPKVKTQNAVPLKPVYKPKIKTPAKTFSIIQTSKADPVNQLLQDAYSAFQNNDFDRSQTLYAQVNQREPKNRDALLGQAATAVKQHHYEFARQKYQALLKLNPKDSLATAGISSIENKIDPQLNISQLKFMLKEQPDAAHLYFALGSLYAAKSNWPEAQSAYFSAWSADNKNADYAYNLAVSLDHLNKPQQALQFYTMSLKLKQASRGNFSDDATRQRIQRLQAGNK